MSSCDAIFDKHGNLMEVDDSLTLLVRDDVRTRTIIVECFRVQNPPGGAQLKNKGDTILITEEENIPMNRDRLLEILNEPNLTKRYEMFSKFIYYLKQSHQKELSLSVDNVKDEKNNDEYGIAFCHQSTHMNITKKFPAFKGKVINWIYVDREYEKNSLQLDMFEPKTKDILLDIRPYKYDYVLFIGCPGAYERKYVFTMFELGKYLLKKGGKLIITSTIISWFINDYLKLSLDYHIKLPQEIIMEQTSKARRIAGSLDQSIISGKFNDSKIIEVYEELKKFLAKVVDNYKFSKYEFIEYYVATSPPTKASGVMITV